MASSLSSRARFKFPIIALVCLTLSVMAAAQSGPHPALAYSSMRYVDAFTVDSQGNVYYADSSGTSTISLVRLAPDGTETLRVAQTIPNGTITRMVADGFGNVYASGFCSASCPAFTTVFGTPVAGTVSGFVAKFGPAGAVLFADGFAGFITTNLLNLNGLAIDSAGNIYIAGVSPCGLPTTPGSFQTNCPVNGSAFAMKISASGAQLVYSTYLHGTSSLAVMNPTSIAVDSSGSLYVTGDNPPVGPGVIPLDWPTTAGAFETVGQPGFGGSVIAKLKPDASGLAYSTFFNEGSITGIAVDSVGQLYSTGSTACSTGGPIFPATPGAAETTPASFCASFGQSVGFALKLNAAGTGLVYASYVNFINANFATLRQGFQSPGGIAVDSSGSAYVTRATFRNGSLPTVNAIQNDLNGQSDVAIVKLNPQGSAYTFVTYLGGMLDDYPTGFGIDTDGAIYVAGHAVGSVPTATGAFPALTVTFGGPNACCPGPQFIAKIVPSSTAAVAVLWGEQPGPSASILFSNPSSFGQVAVGNSASKLFALGNYGAAPMPLGSFSLNDSQFTQTNNCPASIAIGTHCDVTVTFHPTAIGRLGPTLTASDPSGGVLRTLVLDAIGASDIDAFPTLLLFGPQSVGTTSAAQTVTVRNVGSSNQTVNSITVSGDFTATNTCGGTIAPGGTCTIQVMYVPTVSVLRSGSITLVSNPPNDTTVIALSGGGTPNASFSPTALLFGPQAVGTSSAPQTITVTNPFGNDLTFSSIVVSGDFNASNTCSGILKGGGNPKSSCTIQVSFVPTAGGQRSGTITLLSTPDNVTTVIALAGTGVAPDFSMATASGGSATATVTAGQTATYSLSLTPSGNFSGTVALTCTGAPATTTCTANPASVNLSGSAAVPYTVTVSTVARSGAVPGQFVSSNAPPSSPLSPFGHGYPLALMLTPLALASLGRLRAATRRSATHGSATCRNLTLALSVVALLVGIGCGGSGSSSTPKVTGTTAGTYTLIITATSGATSHTINLTLNVQ
jgi:Beta-propeller repeat